VRASATKYGNESFCHDMGKRIVTKLLLDIGTLNNLIFYSGSPHKIHKILSFPRISVRDTRAARTRPMTNSSKTEEKRPNASENEEEDSHSDEEEVNERENEDGILFRDSRFMRLVGTVVVGEQQQKPRPCRMYVNKLKNKEKKTTTRDGALDDDDVYLGYSKCERVDEKKKNNKVNLCLQCYENLFRKYLDENEQREFKTMILTTSDENRLERYQTEVAKIIRERENKEERKAMARLAKQKRIEEEKRRRKEEEEKRRKEEEEERLERERVRLLARKMEEKEKFFSRREQREFTNKELLEIVNNTEEGKKILEREKERLQLEIAKVESTTEIFATKVLFMRVEAFTNVKDAQSMVGTTVTMALVNKEGLILERFDCLDIRNEAVSEEIGEGIRNKLPSADIYYTSGAECCFQMPCEDIPEDSSVIIELKHFKSDKNKTSVKCWSYVTMKTLRSGFQRADTEDDVRISLPLASKPVDFTTKTWVNYNWKTNLIKNRDGYGKSDVVVYVNLV